jgi:hypothetical protein
MMAPAVQTDAAWLRLPDYGIVPMNLGLTGRTSELKRALNSGLCAYPDATRKNFYDVELPTGWAYIHVRDDHKTVHLIAYSRA